MVSLHSFRLSRRTNRAAVGCALVGLWALGACSGTDSTTQEGTGGNGTVVAPSGGKEQGSGGADEGLGGSPESGGAPQGTGSVGNSGGTGGNLGGMGGMPTMNTGGIVATGGTTPEGGAAGSPGEGEPTCADSHIVWTTPIVDDYVSAKSVYVSDLAEYANGDFVVTGYISAGSNITFDSGGPHEQTFYAGQGSPFWAKFDEHGEFLVAGSFLSSQGKSAGIATYADGSHIMAGQFYQGITFDWQKPGEISWSTDGYNDRDAYVARVGSDGDLDWVVHGDPANGSCQVLHMAQKPNGNVVVVVLGGEMTFAPNTVNAHTGGEYGYGLFEFTPAGVPVTSATFSLQGQVNDIVALSDGSIVLVGQHRYDATFKDDVDVVLTGGSPEQLFVARYSSDMALDWVRGGGVTTIGSTVIEWDAETVLVTGRGAGEGAFDPSGPLHTDLPGGLSSFTAFYSSAGELLEVNRTGGASSSFVDISSLVTDEGDLLTVGSWYYQHDFGDPDSVSLSGTPHTDGYIQCLAPGGTLGWVDHLYGTQHERPVAAVRLSGGDVIVLGTMTEDVTIGHGDLDAPVVPVGWSSTNGFLVRLRP